MAYDYDVEGARKAGLSDDKIADYLASQTGYDIGAARKAGVPDTSIIGHLTGAKIEAPKPKMQVVDPLKAPGALDPAQGQSFWENFSAGAGKAVSDTMRGATQVIGKAVQAHPLYAPLVPDTVKRLFGQNQAAIDESAKLDKPLMGTGAGVAGNVAGNVAMTLIPGAAVGAAGKAANAPALLAAGRAITAPASYGAAAAGGAALGGLQPVTTEQGEGRRVLNAGTGALGGMAGRLVSQAIGSGYRTAKAAAEPLYEKGQDAILGRMLNKAAGGEAPAVAQRLAEAAKPAVGPFQPGMTKGVMGELVPGSVPTVGQAAENAGIAALERTATATSPEVTTSMGQRMAQQNAARLGQLENMAGTDGARAMFDAARGATADQLYGKAFAAGITPARAAKYQGEVATLLQNPAIQDALPAARRLAKFDGMDLADPAGSLQGLHYVKKALDDMLDRAKQTGIGRIEQAKIADTKNALLGLMDRLSPAYGAARAEFQAASRPINQMDIAGRLIEKAKNPLTEVIQPQAFARNLNDGTAAAATGFKGATLENVMEGPQINTLQSILADLRRSSAAQTAGRGPGSDTVQKLAYTNLIDQSGMPTFLRKLPPMQVAGNLAGRGADAVYGRANREIADRAAQVMLEPGMAAELMARAARAGRPGPFAPATLQRLGSVAPVVIAPQLQQQ